MYKRKQCLCIQKKRQKIFKLNDFHNDMSKKSVNSKGISRIFLRQKRKNIILKIFSSKGVPNLYSTYMYKHVFIEFYKYF